MPESNRTLFVGWDDEKGKEQNGKGEKEQSGNNDKKDEPKHIRDNAFLVEEAFNQEPGQVQHIFNWVNQWDKTSFGKARDFSFTYTMELPLGSQTHQFSFTTQILSFLDEPVVGPRDRTGGVGDTFLNYRYQLLANDEFLWCAPRLSLILPTGDRDFGLGMGELGYQFNLPVSHYGESFDYHFNAGMTFFPQVSVPLPSSFNSPGHDLRSYNLGASVFWKPRTNFNLFVETLALSIEQINEHGSRVHFNQVFVNPGFRYAVCQLEEVEWVVGVSAPIGLTKDTPQIGIFLYLSVEHGFLKKKKEAD